MKVRLLIALVMAASMWLYVGRVLVPAQRAYAAVHAQPRGNFSDLYPRWLGARELLLHHRDPYSAAVTQEIQMGYYGRALGPDRPDDPKDEQRFAYPVYVVFLLAPSVILPFSVARGIFLWALPLLLAASFVIWIRVLRWRPGLPVQAGLLILLLGCFGVVQGIKLQQLSLLIAFFIAAAVALLVNGQLFSAGAILALATIKPQLLLLPTACLLLWAVSRWRERQRMLWGFICAWMVLIAAGEYVLPGWITRFRNGVSAYEGYTNTASALDMVFTSHVGRPLAALLILGLAAICWHFRRAEAASEGFQVMLLLVLAVTVVTVPKAAPYNQVLLLPAVLYIAQQWGRLWTRDRIARLACAAAGFVVLWPWLASLVLVSASFLLPAAVVQRRWTLPLWTQTEVPLAVLWVLSLCLREVWPIAQGPQAPVPRR